MAKIPVKIWIPALAAALLLAGAVTVGVFFFRYLHRSPVTVGTRFGGVVRDLGGGRAEISGLRFDRVPDMAQLVEELARFERLPQIEFRGAAQLPGLDPVSFFVRAVSGGRPGLRKIDFQLSSDSGRTLSGAGEVDLVSKWAELTVKGEKMGAAELAALGLILPDHLAFHGTVAEFSARFRLAGAGFAPVGVPEISGRLDDGARLTLHALALAGPIGGFRVAADPMGHFRIVFADATLRFFHLEVKSPEITLDGGRKLLLAGAAVPLPPNRSSAPLMFTGEIAADSLNWKFEAKSAQTLIFHRSGCTAVLEKLEFSGQGGRNRGKVRIGGSGESLTCRPDAGAAQLWTGSGLQFSGESEFAIDKNGLFRVEKQALALDFDRVFLSDPLLSVIAGKTAVELKTGTEADAPVFQFRTDGIECAAKDRTLRLAGFGASGSLAFVAGELRKFVGVRLEASASEWRAGGRRIAAESLTGLADFNLRPEAPGRNLALKLALVKPQAEGGGRVLEAATADWALDAELRPENWNPAQLSSRIALRRGSLARTAIAACFETVSAAFRQPGIEEEPEEWEIEAGGFSLRPNPGKAADGGRGPLPGTWALTADTLTFAGRHHLDGAEGRLKLDGGKISGADFELSGIELELPFVPPSAGVVPKGRFAVAAVGGKTGLLQSIQAEVTCRGADLAYRGRTGSGFFAGNGFFFTGKLDRRDGVDRLVTEFNLPSAQLTAPVELSELLPLPGPIRYSGRLGAAGVLTLGFDRSDLKLGFELDGDAATGGLRFEKLTGTIFHPVGGDAESKLRFRSFSAGKLVSGEGELVLACRNSTFALQAVDAAGWSGFVQLRQPVGLDHGMEKLHLDLAVKSIDASALFPPAAWKSCIDRTVSGALTVELDHRAGRMVSAELKADAPGKMRMTPMEKFRLRGNSGETLLRFAAAAWADFDFQQLRLRVRRLENHWLLHLDADGRPAAPIPFVYTKEGFRPAAPGEYGFDGEVDIGGDYAIEVAD